MRGRDGLPRSARAIVARYTWGFSHEGQLGTGEKNLITVPQRIEKFNGHYYAFAAEAGGRHTTVAVLTEVRALPRKNALERQRHMQRQGQCEIGLAGRVD